ncbi:MAG: Sec-independent protein translocase protein TatB [Caldilineaceae bacterium]|nr:Sec-independent protein translocase protein TatB [Caldilineaceae bacterium]
MESFFGIGVFELVFIFIFALIFLGPERLPQVMRQVLGFIRQIRELSSDISKQINDEFGDLGELDPRRQVKQIMDEATTPVKKELTSTAKSTATPKTNPNATPKKPVVKTESAARPIAKTTPAQKSDKAAVASESTQKVDGAATTSPEVAATTESTVVAVTAAKDGHMNGGPVEIEGNKAEATQNGTSPEVVEAPADYADDGHTIAPPSLQQVESSAQAEESQAKREPVTQRTAEEGSV